MDILTTVSLGFVAQCLDDNLSRILADNKSDEATRVMIDKMLLERLALAAIARITGVSERWLQIYVNNKYEQIQQKVDVTQKKKRVN